MRELRRWVMPVAVGNPALIGQVTANLRTRPATALRMRRWWRSTAKARVGEGHAFAASGPRAAEASFRPPSWNP